MIKRLIVPLFAVLVIGLVAAGCGSSDDSTTGGTEGGETSTASITKPEFVKEANAICAKSNAQIESEFEEFAEEEGLEEGEAPSQEVQESAFEKIVVPGVGKQLEEIRALGFPEGEDGEEAEAILASAEEDLEENEEDPTNEDAFKQTNKEARAYGLTVCGEEGE